MGWKQMSQFGLKLYLNQQPGPKKLLGFDIGSINTGVSVSCDSLTNAYLLKVIKEAAPSKKFTQKILKTIKSEENVKGVIIGRPTLPMSSSLPLQKIDEIIEQIMSRMQGSSYNEMPYCYVDENWTTAEAKDKIREIKQKISYHGHLHGQKDLQDGIAAMKILERYLQYYNKK